MDKASENLLQKQAADALSLLNFEEQQDVLQYLTKLAEWKEDCGRRFIIAESC
jgi:hypothetical protein